VANALAALGGEPVRTRPFAPWPVFGPEEERALLETLRSGRWGRLDGRRTAAFEERFARYQGAEYGVAVVSGTAALRVAVLAAGVEAGDEVIVPAYTFIATASAVVESNAVPIFVDVEPDTYNIDPAAVEAAVTPRTRAVIAVHFAGHAADMDAIMAVAGRHGLTVIEDAAHAHGAEYRGRRAGAIGHLGCFSFQSSKNLTGGEGGMVTTSDRRLADACRAIHNVGRLPGSAWYEHGLLGRNYRMGEFVAALLDCQMDRLDEQTERREANARRLAAQLREVPGLSPLARRPYATRHSWHLFITRYDASVFGVPREVLLAALRAEGIPVGPGYVVPLYRQPVFLDLRFGPYNGYLQSRPDLDYGACRCPVTERACGSEAFWLPQTLLLGPAADMDDIASACRKVYERRDDLPKVRAAS
jgi:dTDP-4-amino-4,6-dideoxygalactose transaminase